MRRDRQPGSCRGQVCSTLLVVETVCVLAGGVVVGTEAAEAPLRRVAEVKALGNEGAEVALPVRLEAVVTAFKPMLFVVQDESGAIFVDPAGLRDEVKVGQRVEVAGWTAKGGFAPIVTHPSVTVLGPGSLPEAKPISWDHLLTGRDDNAWVEVRGVVRAATNAYEQLRLLVAGQDRQFTVWCRILPGQRAPEPLLDAELRIHGVYQTLFSDDGRLTGFQLQVPDLQHLVIERPAPADPFAAPVRPIGSLLRFNPAGGWAHRVHLQGVVLFHEPGAAVYLRDETGGIRAGSTTPEILVPGELVSVVGFPDATRFPPELEMASFRKTGSGPAPRPVEAPIEDLLAGGHNFELVRLDATLVQVTAGQTKPILTLATGAGIIEAHAFRARASLEGLREGSLLRIAGIGVVDYDEHHQVRSLGLRLRDPPDITVLRHPPWWTLSKLLGVVGGLGAVLALTAVWVVSLRARVQEQTAAMRIQLEREIALELKYRPLAESSPVGIWQTAPDGSTVYANVAMCRLLGVGGPDELRQVAWQHVFPAREPEARPVRPDGSAAGPAGVFEAEVLGRDGCRRQLMVSSAPLSARDGSSSGVIHSCVDVTEQRRAAEEVAAARHSAEAASRAKSEFLATMSHEIRTPMNGVLGIIGLLHKTSLDVAQRNLLHDCAESARSLLAILNNILDYVKIEGGQLPIEPQEFALGPLIQEVLEASVAAAGAKPVRTSIEGGPAISSRWYGDPIRLRQVLLHLVGNALKFTESGSVILRVSSRATTDQQARVRFEVADTGIGISEARQRLIFQPFHQADASETRRFGGSGLGLAICRRLVELMGGTIGVRSQEGQGSTFWIELELRLSEEPDLARLRVLVAEVHPLNQRLALLTLGKLGCSAGAVSTGAELIAAVRQDAWDVLLLSRHLPDLSLECVLRQIQAPETRTDGRGAGHFAVVDLIAAESAGDAEAFRAAGVRRCLARPFTVRQVHEALLRVRHGGEENGTTA